MVELLEAETVMRQVGYAAAFSPDCKTVATGGYVDEEHAVKLWEVATGKECAVLKGLANEYMTSVVFSPDGKSLAAGCGGTIGVWDVPTGKLLATLKGHKSDIWSLAFRSDGKILAAGGEKTIKLWDLASGK